MLVGEGSGRFNIDGQWHQVSPYSVVIYNPGVWHEECLELYESHHVLFLGFSRFQLPGMPAGRLTLNRRSYVIEIREHYRDMSNRFFDIMRHKDRLTVHSEWIANCLTAAFLVQLISFLEPAVPESATKRTEEIRFVKQYIDEHYSEPLTLRILSNIALLSPYYLSRLFKAETSVSPIQYVIACRMESAKHLLSHTNDPVAVIAEKVGYSSETHFQNLFKKWCGTTPSRFRTGAKEG
jgi:AraC-like DNA-binding protein